MAHEELLRKYTLHPPAIGIGIGIGVAITFDIETDTDPIANPTVSPLQPVIFMRHRVRPCAREGIPVAGSNGSGDSDSG